MRRPLAWGRTTLAGLLAALGCILPDRGIDVTNEQISNRAPVRFAEQTALTPEADHACGEVCPQPGADIASPLPHFLDPTFEIVTSSKSVELPYAFCSCPPGTYDDRALSGFTLYVEDRDEDEKRKPADNVYAALQLDLDPSDPDPARAFAYATYVDPDRRLDFADIDYEPILRTSPHLRALQIGDEELRVDLCNRAQSAPLVPGYHSLRVIVSDRPWFKVDGRTQPGVPDLSVGATFDTVTFVFACGAPESEECKVSCRPPENDDE